MDKPTDRKAMKLVSGENMKKAKDIQLLRRYWDSMRINGAMPRRADIDPRGIQSLLEYALIIEKIAPGLARMRIAGQHLSDLMGMEVRGMPITSFISPQDRDRMGAALSELFERPAAVTFDLTSPGSLRQPAVSARLMLLPLSSDLGDISRALGCFVSTGPTGRAPRRFDIDHVHTEPLSLADPAHADKAAAPTPAPGFAEPQAGFQRPESQPISGELPSERSYLRLVR
ncbi:MAG: PAS domain-containing protein [Roseovarius sp.]